MSSQTKQAVPSRLELLNPLLISMHSLGGSGTVTEIADTVAKHLELSEEQLNIIHRGSRTKFAYELAWARQYLRKYGYLDLSQNKIWSLTVMGRKNNKVDPKEVNKNINALTHKRTIDDQISNDEEEELTWQTKLLNEIVIRKPSAFEQICKRVLRESGFIEVEVTGKPGDMGIDGKGVLIVGEILTYRAKFQAKRYRLSNPVGADEVREFRGSLTPSEKGVLMTTSRFTEAAKNEATRDGMTPIDLIDGEKLAQLMKKFRLGVKTETKEIVTIDDDWFTDF
jgi:restriction system protein